MEDQKNSITFDVTFPSGITALFTIREGELEKAKNQLALAMAMDKIFVEKGIKPHIKSFGGGQKKEKEWTGDICPKDGGKLYHIITKSGKDLLKCEKSTYINGVAGGCDFVAWGKNLKDAQEQKAKWRAQQTADINF